MLLRGRRRKRKTPVVRRGSAALKSGRNHLQQKNQGVFNKSRSYRQCIADKTSDRLMFSLWAGSQNWVSSCGPFPIKPSIKPPIKPSVFAYGKGVFETPENILFFEGAVVDRRLNSPKIARLEGIFLAAGLTLMWLRNAFLELRKFFLQRYTNSLDNICKKTSVIVKPKAWKYGFAFKEASAKLRANNRPWMVANSFQDTETLKKLKKEISPLET